MSDRDYSDVGDLADLKARLKDVRDESSRRTVFVVGSGLSNSVMPNVSAIVDIFRSYLPAAGQARVDQLVSDIDPTLSYQNAAAVLKRQGGDAKVARALREATLYACRDVTPPDRREVAGNLDECRRLETEGSWALPRGYRAMARYISSGATGPLPMVITTNFDPLLQVAFREEGHAVHTVPVPTDAAPSVEQIRANPGIPVIHMHGHWLSPSTLNTVTQLSRDRPLLENLLREQLRGAVVLVIGYAGWNDGFMRSLQGRIREMDTLGSELLWSAYSPDPAIALANETVGELYGMPNFTLYCNVDGNAVFEDIRTADGDPLTPPPKTPEVTAPFGYTRVTTSSATLDKPNPQAFLDGAQPSWADAKPGTWPMLGSTARMWRDLKDVVGGSSARGVVASGPTGEGKTLAIRQLAVRAAEQFPEILVLWREPGAPRISHEWISSVVAHERHVLICADDADLIASELQETRGEWEHNQQISWLLSSHDRLWRRKGEPLGGLIRKTDFHGLDSADALAIANAWAEVDATISPDQEKPNVREVAERLFTSAHRAPDSPQSTLFGAVLEVRYGPGLVSRIAQLLDALDRKTVRSGSPTTLGDIYGVICLMQDALDPAGNGDRGATRSLLAATVGLEGVFADGKILQELGKEAAITYTGDRVYSRHPSIAKAVMQVLRAAGRGKKTARLAGLAGGRLRSAGQRVDSARAYQGAYMLGPQLVDAGEAEAAGEGAVEGARNLLEPYVTLLSIRRKYGSPRIMADARKLAANLSSFTDYGTAVRVFLVEFSAATRTYGQHQFTIGLAGMALTDGVGYQLSATQASYALTSITGAARLLRDQSRQASIILPEICSTIITRLSLLHPDVSASQMARLRRDILDTLKDKETDYLVAQLRLALEPRIAAAATEFGLQEVVAEGISLNDLTRLLRPTRAH